MLRKSGEISHPFLNAGTSTKKAVIVITSNRGLAGGYNSNIIKLLRDSTISKEDAVIYAIGRKGKEGLQRRGYQIKQDYSEVLNAPLYKDAIEIGRAVLDAFRNGEVGEIYLAYTVFKNTVSHIPTLLKLFFVEVPALRKGCEISPDLRSILLTVSYIWSK